MAILFTVVFFVGLIVLVRSVRWWRCLFWLVWMLVGALLVRAVLFFANGTLWV